MSVSVQRFDPRAAIEAIVYIASKAPAPGFHKIAKIFYFADKLHLERYGSMLSNDTYIAMDNGPVPSRIYDLMKFAGGRNVPPENAIVSVKEAIHVEGYVVEVKREPNIDFLSQSMMMCLDEVIASHGRKSFGQLSDESHDTAWGSVTQDSAIPLTEIIKTLPDGDALLEHYLK